MKAIVGLLILVTVERALVVNASTYYITLGPYKDKNETNGVFLQWSTIQHDISKYFTSHTVICFLSGEYNLDIQMTVTDFINCTITGKAEVIFKCTSNEAVIIKTSVDVRIQNMKFENCGVRIPSIINVFTTAVSLHNVQSVVLSNITFENSLGHGIVGINVLGTSTLVNITVYHNNNLSGNSITPIGGIILVYVDTIDDVHHNQTQSQNNVLINNCTICYDGSKQL